MKIGEFNELTLLRFTSVGAYLEDEQENDVLLPNKYLTNEMELDDKINVFIYRDSEDRVVATTEIPKIEMNGFAYLKVTAVNHFGAFADWGLEKELMIPFKEQYLKLEEGNYYLMHLGLDEKTDRVYGSTKVNRYLQECTEDFDEEAEVELMVCERTDLGTKVIVNGKYSGLVFKNDVSKRLRRGQKIIGYVVKVREDGKIDIRLDKSGGEKILSSADKLLEILRADGEILLTDKSDPDLVREVVGMSKKTFKQAIGKLYRERVISLDEGKITFLK
ncbi:MAG: GntR family transcriptional regulator [Fluviicola sp.]|nr:GntR family transcriptional regulator [Fluviicola sp.]